MPTMDIDRAGQLQRSRWPSGRLLVLWMVVALAGLAGAGCVETAECNESVSCPPGEICYRFSCRSRCEDDSDCGDGEVCRRCQESGSDENHCLGERARACVAGE